MTRKELLFELLRESAQSKKSFGRSILISSQYKILAEHFDECENDRAEPTFIDMISDENIVIFESNAGNEIIFTNSMAQVYNMKYQILITAEDIFE
jgi:hypothetical protein